MSQRVEGQRRKPSSSARAISSLTGMPANRDDAQLSAPSPAHWNSSPAWLRRVGRGPKSSMGKPWPLRPELPVVVSRRVRLDLLDLGGVKRSPATGQSTRARISCPGSLSPGERGEPANRVHSWRMMTATVSTAEARSLEVVVDRGPSRTRVPCLPADPASAAGGPRRRGPSGVHRSCGATQRWASRGRSAPPWLTRSVWCSRVSSRQEAP